MQLKDSGERREFDSGAVRDCAEGKGREDLLPLATIGSNWADVILYEVGLFVETGDVWHIKNAVDEFVKIKYHDTIHPFACALMDAARQYEDGCQKYGDRNWEKGIPVHCYIDSGVRHYLKWLDKWDDEPHDRAFLWNMFGALWTIEHKPELDDVPHNAMGKEIPRYGED